MSGEGCKVDMDIQVKTWHSFNKFMVWVGVVGAVLAVALPYIVVF